MLYINNVLTSLVGVSEGLTDRRNNHGDLVGSPRRAEVTSQNPWGGVGFRSGSQQYCSLVTRSREQSAFVFLWPSVCRDGICPQAACSPSRGLTVVVFLRMVSVQFFPVRWASSFSGVLTVSHSGAVRVGGPKKSWLREGLQVQEQAGMACGPRGVSLSLLAALSWNSCWTSSPAGPGSLVPCLSFPPGPLGNQ